MILAAGKQPAGEIVSASDMASLEKSRPQTFPRNEPPIDLAFLAPASFKHHGDTLSRH